MRSTKAVQVIGGHSCAQVPIGVPYCDHLEASMLPVASLGTKYLLANPSALERPRFVRVVATQPETSLSYDPPQPDLPSAAAMPGDFLTFETSETFALESNQPVLVAEYMSGGGKADGDPSLIVASPLHRFRATHLVHVSDFERIFIQIFAPNGATVSLDGVELDGFIPIGASGYAVLEVPLAPGPHRLHASAPIGVQLFGLDYNQSYWHPGG